MEWTNHVAAAQCAPVKRLFNDLKCFPDELISELTAGGQRQNLLDDLRSVLTPWFQRECK